MSFDKTDILIIGSGLAAYRAAISAVNHSPGLSVTIVSNRDGPSGSSFANINNALGMTVLSTDREKELFVDRATEIATPGNINRSLATILADESRARFDELADMGISFSKSCNGTIKRFPCCFLQSPPLAGVITDLPGAFSILNKRFKASGGKIITGLRLTDLIKSDCDRITGALFFCSDTHTFVPIQADIVIVATGGPSTLFQKSLAAPGSTGDTPAILENAGAPLVNMGFFQFLWYETKTLKHWPAWTCMSEDPVFICDGSGRSELPDDLQELALSRKSHVPVSWGMPDSEFDRMLFSYMNSDGELTVNQSGQTFCVAPFSHACNGGAKIDMNGATGIPGLYVCGEAAGGMHGANRIGGAMVLSTQVFGHRAGVTAAMMVDSLSNDSNSFKVSVQPLINSKKTDTGEWFRGKKEISSVLNRCFFSERYSPALLASSLTTLLETAVDWRYRLALKTVRIIINSRQERINT